MIQLNKRIVIEAAVIITILILAVCLIYFGTSTDNKKIKVGYLVIDHEEFSIRDVNMVFKNKHGLAADIKYPDQSSEKSSSTNTYRLLVNHKETNKVVFDKSEMCGIMTVGRILPLNSENWENGNYEFKLFYNNEILDSITIVLK